MVVDSHFCNFWFNGRLDRVRSNGSRCRTIYLHIILMSKNLAKKICLALVVTLLCIIAFDALLRVTNFGLFYFNTNAAYNIRRYPWLPKCYRYVANVNMRSGVVGDLSWISGDHERRHEVTFKTDSLGFRNSTELDAYDTVLLGDSFGVATLTDQDQILSERMRALGKATYNMSVDGAGIWNEVVTFAHEIDKIPLSKGARVEWLLFEGNDLEGRFFSELPLENVKNPWVKAMGAHLQNYYKNSVLKKMGEAVLAHRAQPTQGPPSKTPVREAVLKLNLLGKDIFFNETYVETLKMTREDVFNHGNAKDIKRCYEFLKKKCAEKKLELRCVIIPTKARVYQWLIKGDVPWSSQRVPSPFSLFFSELSKELGVDFLDLTPMLIDQSQIVFERKGDFLFWYNDTHWNDIAQGLVAERLIKSF